MKQIKGIILKPNDKDAKQVLGEITALIEDNWVIANQNQTQDAIVYILAKVPQNVLDNIQRQQLASALQ